MSRTVYSNKAHVRADNKPCSITCYICKQIGKKKSKKFNTLYALKFHLTTNHPHEDEISAGVTKRQILQTVRAISQALEWNILIDIPKTKFCSYGDQK